MGEGKTETALWRHTAGRELRDGLVWGMPTTATADSMLVRILDFYSGSEGYLHLGHSRAILNAFYRPSPAQPTSICDDDDPADRREVGLHPGGWFSGRHRALTAPISLVTCDQVLAVGVSHKFAPVRLAALAGKHVVLDEVHTYDPYQDRLLCRVLGWLGFYRCRVTLLTATLPTRRLRSYVAAYRSGWHRFARTCGEVDVQGVYPAVTLTDSEGGVVQQPLAAFRRYTHRIVYHRLRESIWTQETVRLMEQVIAADPQARVGVIVNQVDRAIAVARGLAERGRRVVLLHARMTYKQRACALAELLAGAGKDAPEGPLTMVATQLAEASLDIDMDILFSDLAPAASLLQRMGRQWRHSTPVSDGHWQHPATRQRRAGDPVLHVLVPVDGTGDLHPRGHYPYSRAEVLRTWREPRVLGSGSRTALRIPDDVQAVVDDADVSLADLRADPVDVMDEALTAALTDHLAATAKDVAAGDRVGVDAETIDRSWRAAMREETDDAWAGVPALATLTRGRIWREEAVTRLRKTDSLQLLLYDPTNTNPHAWHGDLPGLLKVRDHEQVVEVLDHVIAVSGRLAGTLRRAAGPAPDGWHSVTLLREVVPLRIDRLPTGCQLSNYGLEQPTEG